MDYEFVDDEAVPMQVMQDDAMWEAFHGLGIGLSAYLIHPSNGTCVWITGEAKNGPTNFYVEREVIQELQSLGLVTVTRDSLPKGIDEGYELTDEGRQVYKQYRDMPHDQGEGQFLILIHEMRRRR